MDYAALQGLCVDHRTFGSGSAFGGAEATCYQTGCHKVREPSTSRLLHVSCLAIWCFWLLWAFLPHWWDVVLCRCIFIIRFKQQFFGYMYTPLLDQPRSPSLGWFTTVNLVPRDSTGATSRCDIDKAEFYGETPLQARKKQVHLRRVFSVWYWWEFDGFLHQNSGKIERNFEGYFMPEQRKSPATSKSQVACRKGHAEIVLLLCAARANLETQDDDGQTCLMAACNAGHTGIVRDSGVGKTGIRMRASRFPLRRRPLLVNTFSINYVTFCYYVSRLYFKKHATSTANFPCPCPQARVLLEQGADPRHAEAQHSTSMGLTGCSHAGEGSVPWCLGDIRDGLPPRWGSSCSELLGMTSRVSLSSCLVLQRLLPSETLDFCEFGKFHPRSQDWTAAWLM